MLWPRRTLALRLAGMGPVPPPRDCRSSDQMMLRAEDNWRRGSHLGGGYVLLVVMVTILALGLSTCASALNIRIVVGAKCSTTCNDSTQNLARLPGQPAIFALRTPCTLTWKPHAAECLHAAMFSPSCLLCLTRPRCSPNRPSWRPTQRQAVALQASVRSK